MKFNKRIGRATVSRKALRKQRLDTGVSSYSLTKYDLAELDALAEFDDLDQAEHQEVTHCTAFLTVN